MIEINIKASLILKNRFKKIIEKCHLLFLYRCMLIDLHWRKLSKQIAHDWMIEDHNSPFFWRHIPSPLFSFPLLIIFARKFGVLHFENGLNVDKSIIDPFLIKKMKRINWMLNFNLIFQSPIIANQNCLYIFLFYFL